jgi:hypothetical protein
MSNTKVSMGDSVAEPEETLAEVTEEVSEVAEEAVVTEEGQGNFIIEVLDMDEESEEEYGLAVEDLDPKEELWPGGPTAGDIVAWKAEYGDVYVTSITMDQHIIWRTMNRSEYKTHVKNIEKIGQNNQISQADVSMLNEELIAEMCIIYPKFDRAKLNGELAGVPSIIAQEVMEASGFVALEVRQL